MTSHLPSSNLQYDTEIDTKPKAYFLFAGVILFIVVAALLYQSVFGQAGLKEYMRAFMGVFFLSFSGFKLLDLKGFMMSYVGYVYPFIELALGAAFLLNLFVNLAYLTDILVMGVGSIGVVQQLLRGRKIRCACLGSYIKLPLTTISLIEDLTMLGMGLVSLFIA